MGDRERQTMFEVVAIDHSKSRTAVAADIGRWVSAAAAESRFVLVKLAPDQSGKMDWINVMHHDLAAALRSMRYLTQKAKASYNSADLRAAQILASIDQHLATLERLKADVVDTIFPVEG